ncbi:hypothetical protein [Streptomyces sp. HF10]|uniref:hypothetical protein n=1 Tax=Streptomyces sp. HF10 TaxID=2692233 RepID=UPI001315E0A3|nr:hypothetical protein [Streptomyces sp. HF10]QHC33017.1 hypothetical protein GR129_33905 [Streptomyces sp. HF10]
MRVAWRNCAYWHRKRSHACRAGVAALAAGLLTLGAPCPGRAAETGRTPEFTVSGGGNPLPVPPYQGDCAPAYSQDRNTGS